MTQTAQATSFAMLAGHKYINLTTFRKNGQPVVTPVWFAQEDDRLYVMTGAGSGKVRRIRRNSRVLIAPSSARGNPRGPAMEATARLLPPSEADRANAALDRKYGWQKRAYEALERLLIRFVLLRQAHPTAFLEIVAGDV